MPRLQQLPARPRLADIIAATSREFGVAETELQRRRHTPARLSLAYVARHEAALKLVEFSPALGIQGWAASQLATAAERLARKNRRFQQSIRRIQRSLAEPLTRAIKTLTVAVWCLCVLVLAQLGFYGWSYIRSMPWARQAMTTATSSIQSVPSRVLRPEPSEERPFHEMPPEEMVARSSVILLASYQDDGKKNKAIVGEILKQDPNVTLYYSVGDEMLVPEVAFTFWCYFYAYMRVSGDWI